MYDYLIRAEILNCLAANKDRIQDIANKFDIGELGVVWPYERCCRNALNFVTDSDRELLTIQSEFFAEISEIFTNEGHKEMVYDDEEAINPYTINTRRYLEEGSLNSFNISKEDFSLSLNSIVRIAFLRQGQDIKLLLRSNIEKLYKENDTSTSNDCGHLDKKYKINNIDKLLWSPQPNMAEWQKDVNRHCNDIYQNSTTEEDAELIINSVISGRQDTVSSILDKALKSGNNKLFLGVYDFNKMCNYTRDCLQDKSQHNVDNHIWSLKIAVTHIMRDRKAEMEGNFDIEDNSETANLLPKTKNDLLQKEQVVINDRLNTADEPSWVKRGRDNKINCDDRFNSF